MLVAWGPCATCAVLKEEEAEEEEAEEEEATSCRRPSSGIGGRQVQRRVDVHLRKLARGVQVICAVTVFKQTAHTT